MLEIMLQSYYIFLYDFSYCKIAVLYLGAFPAVLFTFLVKTGQNQYGVELKKRVFTKASTLVGRKPSTNNQIFSLLITS